jgi:L-threonylcarbamoyladenylate synthase
LLSLVYIASAPRGRCFVFEILMFTEVNKALEIISNGGVIAYPTDTVWGIGCNAQDEAAIRRIYQLKQRDDSKSLIILLADAKDVLKYIAQPHPDIVDQIKQYDRPTTVIYTHPINLPNILVAADNTIAIRVTQDPFCKTLIKRLKQPIVSTSANLSGQPTPQRFKDIDMAIRSGVDYVVDYRQEEDILPAPSRIIKWEEDGSCTVIRP